MRDKCLCSLVVTILFVGMTISSAQAGKPQKDIGTLGGLSFSGRIIEFNEEHRFVVINLGSSDGVKKGMILSVFQKDEEVAKLKANKVRGNISACDIQMVYSGRGIAVGDVVIYKESRKLPKSIEIASIVVDIDAPKPIILDKSFTVLQEFGLIVTQSDSKKYILQAHKYLDLPLDVGLITDWGPSVRDKILYTVEITATPQYNRLIVKLRGVYDKAGQVHDHELNKNSTVYKEAQAMAFKIKDLAEKL